MKVVVSILNWNNLSKTLQCLESLKDQAHTQVVVCVTDNNSISFDHSKILEIRPDAKIFVNQSNVGFAEGHQKALKFSQQIKASLFWILNNDVVVQKDSLKSLIYSYEQNGPGIYGSASVDKKGTPRELGMWALDSNNKNSCSFKEISPEKLANSITITVANVFGFSMMIPLTVILEYGFMDSSFFLYYEETDYCLKLLKRGIPSYWVGSSKVFHEKEGSTVEYPFLKEIMEYYLYRNLFLLLKKHAPFQLTFTFLSKFFMRFLSANVARKKKVLPLSKRHIIGIVHGLVGIRGKFYKPEEFLN